MGIFNVIFHILLLCSHFLSANVCDVEYTKQPTNGHRCVASSNTEVTLRQTDRPQCMLKCLQLKTCRYINHNYDTGQCDLGLDKCESLVPAIGVEVNVLGPHRDACEHWAPRQRLGHVLVEVRIPGDVMYLARIKIDKTLLVGKFINGWFWGNKATFTLCPSPCPSPCPYQSPCPNNSHFLIKLEAVFRLHQFPYQSPIQCHQISVRSVSIGPPTVKNWYGRPFPSESCKSRYKITLWRLAR